MLRFARVFPILLASLLGTAAMGFGSQGAPALKVTKAEADLGNQSSGPTLWFSFKLRNEGTAPLEILDVHPSCGCMAVESERTIAPGKEITLWVKMTTSDKEGAILKSVNVTTNDPQTPTVNLVAKVNLTAPIRVVEGRYFVLKLKKGQPATQEVTLESHEPGPLEITKVETTPNSLQAEILPAGPNPQVRKLRLTMADPEQRQFSAQVIVHTNSKKLPEIPLNVTAIPTAAVFVVPERLYFDPVYEQIAQPVIRMVMLARGDQPFTIESAQSDNPALELKVMAQPKSLFGEVQVTYKGGWKPGKIEGKITLKLAETENPTVEVPYSGTVKAGKDPGVSVSEIPGGAAPVPIPIPGSGETGRGIPQK